MASMSAPSTPVAVISTPTVASDAPTGTWKHPRFDEIQRRTNASTFNDRNVRAILWNAAVFITTLFLPSGQNLRCLHPSLDEFAKVAAPYSSYILLLIRTLPLLGILYACSPLLRTKDDLTDIPLTPTQRALLGLKPASRPATPGSHYITPPRYARSSTPRSGSGSLSGSPFSGMESIGSGVAGSGTGRFSPAPSPLLHKATQRDVGRRSSLGNFSPSMLGKSITDSNTALVLNSPSPTGGRGASVGLNSRWLYEKQRASSGLKGMYS